MLFTAELRTGNTEPHLMLVLEPTTLRICNAMNVCKCLQLEKLVGALAHVCLEKFALFCSVPKAATISLRAELPEDTWDSPARSRLFRLLLPQAMLFIVTDNGKIIIFVGIGRHLNRLCSPVLSTTNRVIAESCKHALGNFLQLHIRLLTEAQTVILRK